MIYASDEPLVQSIEPVQGKRPRISVVMPVFNGEKYIEEAITSIQTQSIRDFELVVVNDGSTDGTCQIVETMARDDPRIVLYSQPNRGIVAALNVGMEKATGEFIARMDADDEAMPGRFQIQLEALLRDPELVACGGHSIKFGAESGLVRFPSTDDLCKAFLLFGTCFGHPAIMLRASVLRESRLLYEAPFEYAEDYRLWSVLASHGKFMNVPVPVHRHRIHDSQIGMTKREKQKEAHIAVAIDYWAEAGVSITPELLHLFLWPSLERPRDLGRYFLTFVSVSALVLRLRKHKRHDCLLFAARTFLRNTGRRLLLGSAA